MPPATPAPPNPYLQRRTWIIYLLLFAVSIPWYWRWIGWEHRQLFGVPLWACITMVSSTAISAYTAWLLWFRWPDQSSSEEHDQ